MNWVSIKKELPIVPRNKPWVRVLIASFNRSFHMLNPDEGYEVVAGVYDGEFKVEGFNHTTRSVVYVSVMEEVTHWMYYPKPPIRLWR